MAEEKDAVSVRKAFREELLVSLVIGEITNEVLMQYHGYGDSGGPEEINVPDPAGKLMDFLHSFVYGEHGGYENNEGATGTVTWDLRADVIKVNHGQHYVETAWTDSVY